jgi:hypothetical protein
MKFIFYFAAANLERSDNSCSKQYLNRVTNFTEMGINRCIVYLQQTPRDSASGNVLHLLRLAMSISPRI